MKKFINVQFGVMLLMLGLIGISFVPRGWAQSSYVIPNNRTISWSPGIPGGIPDGYPYYNTSAWPICATIDASTYGNGTTDATSAINTALTNCPSHQVVYLPEGTYKITNSLNLWSSVVLRGAGPGNTKILYYGTGPGNTYGVSNGGIIDMGAKGSDGYPMSTTGSINAGTNTLTVASINSLAPGDWISIANGISQGVPLITSITSINSLTFTVSGITNAPAIGSKYTNNYNSFTVQSTSLTGTPGSISGTITCVLANARSPYQNTLTFASGSGDGAITFSTYTANLTLGVSVPTTVTKGVVSFSPYTFFVTGPYQNCSSGQPCVPQGSTSLLVATTPPPVGSYIVISENNPSYVSVYPYSNTPNTTTGSIVSGTTQLNVASNAGYSVGENITVQNGAANGVNLNTVITNMSGLTLTLGAAAGNTVINGAVYLNGYCAYCGDNNPTRVMGQIVQVTAVNGNTITINRPLYFELDQSLVPTVSQEPMVQQAGLEDVYIHPMQNTTTPAPNILLTACANCWVANIESDTAASEVSVEFNNSYGDVLRDSYIHDAYDHTGGKGYGAWIMGWNSDHLIENNIFRRTRHSMIFEAGGSGVVFGYNYSINNIESTYADNYSSWDSNAISPDESTHGAYPFMNLFEGNVSSQLSFDNAHGNSGFNTAFRNYISGVTSYPTGTPGTSSAFVTWGQNPVNDAWMNENENLAANVLGVPNCGANAANGISNNHYQNLAPGTMLAANGDFTIYAVGYYDGGYNLPPVADPNLPTSILRADNYDCLDKAVPDASGQSIPSSLYYSAKPGWWGHLPWPAIGPDLTTMVGIIPAQQRYMNIQSKGGVHILSGDRTGDENPPGLLSTMPAYINGDLDGDGKVTMADAELAAQAAIRSSSLNAQQEGAAEVDGQSTLDMYDAFLIAEYAIGQIYQFPVQQ